MIYIDHLEKEIGDKVLFAIKKLTINVNDKIGLIGNNGVGKTSLLRILSGHDTEYSGYIDIQTNIAYLLDGEEELEFSEEDYLKAEVDNQANNSPGESQRLKLTKLLSNKSAFLLVDEPTSHLDIKQKEKLIESLRNRKLGFILISHDRDLINQTCNKIFELSNGELEVFNGDYFFYLEEKIKRKKFAQREYDAYVSEKKRLAGIASDIKVQSSKIRTTSKRMGNSEARMGGQATKKKLDKRVKAKNSRINQLEVKERPKEESQIKLSIGERDKIFSKVLVRAKKVNKRFDEKLIFDNAYNKIENKNKEEISEEEE